MTPKQLAANRQNAQKSTGPRTDAGKAASSRNAITHGIRAKDIVINDDIETAEDFEALRSALAEELAPATPLEEILVDRLATLHWRARRVLRAETGAVRLAVSDAVTQSIEEQRKKLEQSLRVLDGLGGSDNPYGAATAVTLREHIATTSMGQTLLLHALRAARADLEAGNPIDPSLRGRLLDFVGPDSELAILLAASDLEPLAALLPQVQPSPRTNDLSSASPYNQSPNSRPKTQDSRLKTQDSPLLSHLTSLITAAEERHALLDQREDRARARRTASLSLPTGEAADRILRYDAALGNAMTRTLTQLRQLQARRTQPAPLVELSD